MHLHVSLLNLLSRLRGRTSTYMPGKGGGARRLLLILNSPLHLGIDVGFSWGWVGHCIGLVFFFFLSLHLFAWAFEPLAMTFALVDVLRRRRSWLKKPTRGMMARGKLLTLEVSPQTP